MPCDVSLLTGISPELALQLRAVGINNSDRLLAAVSKSSMREELAHRLQIAPDLLLAAGRCTEFVRIRGIGNVYADMLTQAGTILTIEKKLDLMRIKGVGPKYATLLILSGVASVPDLARRNAENLAASLAETNEAQHVVDELPGENDVPKWIAQAQELPRVVVY